MKNLDIMSEEELLRILITPDGKGRLVKLEALEILLENARQKVLDCYT